MRGVVKAYFERGPVKAFETLIVIKLDLIQFDLTWFNSEHNYACWDFGSLNLMELFIVRETPKLFRKSVLFFYKVSLIDFESSLQQKKERGKAVGPILFPLTL